MRNRPFRRACGFTLIEIIITLVVLGILAAMVAVFFGPGVTRSSDPIFALQRDADLQAVMENMIAEAEGGATLSALNGDIGTVGTNQTNKYGNNVTTYHVERNSYCSLNTSTNTFENSGTPTDYLCVTISHPSQSGSQISYLFTTQ